MIVNKQYLTPLITIRYSLFNRNLHSSCLSVELQNIHGTLLERIYFEKIYNYIKNIAEFKTYSSINSKYLNILLENNIIKKSTNEECYKLTPSVLLMIM